MKEIIDKILNIPESKTIEFKRLWGQKVVSKIIETIVAFSNSDGGHIVLGINDPDKELKGEDRIFGIEESLENYDEINREIKRIIPSLESFWEPIKIEYQEGKTIAVGFIPKGRENLYSINDKVYIRLEKGNKKLTPNEIIKYSYIRGFKRVDRETVDVDFQLLETEIYNDWKKYRKIEKKNIEEVLYDVGLAKIDNKEIKPTQAAVMLFAEYPHFQMETKCSIRVYQYKREYKKVKEIRETVEKPKIISGPIINQIKEAHQYVLLLLRTGMIIPESGFKTEYKLPERSVKEAITNAVIHRDYYLKRDIEINIYQDQIQIISPGIFPYNITEKTIGKERADDYRNSLLVKHLREFPDPPNLDMNEGVKTMREDMKKNNLFSPIFKVENNEVVNVTLLNQERGSDWDKVYAYLKNNFHINNSKVREIIDENDRAIVSRKLKSWVEKGILIKMEGQGLRNTKYSLLKEEEIIVRGVNKSNKFI